MQTKINIKDKVLTKIIKISGFTIEEFSKYVDISFSYFKKIIYSGFISKKNALKIADFFNIDFETFENILISGQIENNFLIKLVKKSDLEKKINFNKLYNKIENLEEKNIIFKMLEFLKDFEFLKSVENIQDFDFKKKYLLLKNNSNILIEYLRQKIKEIEKCQKMKQINTQ